MNRYIYICILYYDVLCVSTFPHDKFVYVAIYYIHGTVPVVQHEAVPEVSKGKVNINQKNMCL